VGEFYSGDYGYFITGVYTSANNAVEANSNTTKGSWEWQPSPGNIVNGGAYAYFPGNGAYIESGSTVSLEWSADGNMEAFILTQNQFNNFKSGSISISYLSHGSGSNGNTSASISNSDRYFGVVRNGLLTNPSRKLYHATLTSR